MITVSGLGVELFGQGRAVAALRGVSFALERGRALAVVGPSGAGKSTLLFALMRLLPRDRSRVSGSVILGDRALFDLDEGAMRAVRGRVIALVFQDPGAALDPLATIGAQVAEAVRISSALSRREARALAEERLSEVELPDPRWTLDAFPHQLSGGMRQRAVVAMALARDPALLLLDEPTAALDTISAARLMTTLHARRKARGMASILVTHDLGLAACYAEDVAVLADGALVELGPSERVLAEPKHPYTRALVAAGRRRAAPDG